MNRLKPVAKGISTARRGRPNKRPDVRQAAAPTARENASRLTRQQLIVGGLLLLVSVAFRAYALDRMPGFNGDEAAWSVMVRDYLAGRSSHSPFLTTTDRFIPIYASILFALDALGRPSVLLLRSCGLFFGLALMLAAAWAVRRLFVRPVVQGAVFLLIACLPIHVSNARIGWDAAQLSVATLFPVYFLLRGMWPAAILSGAVAFVVHPMAIFLAPIGVMVLFCDTIPNKRWTQATKKAAYLGTVIVAIAAVVYLKVHYLGGPQRAHMPQKEVSLASFMQFLGYLGDVLSGTTTYTYFVVAPKAIGKWLGGALGVGVMLAIVGAAAFAARDRQLAPRRRFFALAVLASVLCYFVVNPQQDPGTERYFLVFTVPLLFALGIACDRVAWPQPRIAAACFVLCAAWLMSFYFFYFRAMQTTAVYTHSLYATGASEPKVAALQWVREDVARTGATAPVAVITDGWWIYWVARYLLPEGSTRERYRVYHIPSSDAPPPLPDRLATLPSLQAVAKKGAYAVGFTDGSFERLNGMLQGIQVCDTQHFNTFAGRPVVTVWRYCAAGQASVQ